MRKPPWYQEWREDASREVMAKQDRLMESHRLGLWPRFDYDAKIGILSFSDEVGPRVIGVAQIVGSISSENWLCSWANPHWDDWHAEEMQRVQQFGVEELTSEYLEGSDLNPLGWEMTAVAARVLGAVGAYRAPDDVGRALSMVCKSVEFVS